MRACLAQASAAFTIHTFTGSLRHVSSLACLGKFNNRTCECECEEREYMEQRLQCEMTKNTYWDTVSCQCRSKSVAPRGVDRYPGAECAGGGVDQQHYGSLGEIP